MAENKLYFVQNTCNFHYIRINFMDLKPVYEKNEKVAMADPVAFWIANIFDNEITRIDSIPINMLQSGCYNTINYAIIP